MLTVGLPDEWEDFEKRHSLFFERFSNLRDALNVAFIRTGETGEPVDRVIFFSGRLCVEDFMEILLLCGNGYGFGAMKILRGMYERVITARYLQSYPQSADDFLDYYWVAQHRQIEAIKQTFGKDALPADKLKEAEANYSSVKDRFLVTHCKKCGTTRSNHTWTELDFVSMARKVGSIGDLIVPAYYFPTVQIHSTAGAILSRLKESEKGGISFKEKPNRAKADETLMIGHNLILNVLDLQREHFGLEDLREPLRLCFEDFQAIWDGSKNRVSTHVNVGSSGEPSSG